MMRGRSCVAVRNRRSARRFFPPSNFSGADREKRAGLNAVGRLTVGIVGGIVAIRSVQPQLRNQINAMTLWFGGCMFRIQSYSQSSL